MSEARLEPCGASCWRVVGVLDFSSVMPLVRRGRELLGQGSLIEIDLAGVTAANSAGLALLLEWLDLSHARGSRLVFRHLPDSLARIAAVSNLESVLPLTDASRA
jgi:phospholipid transport system transporter-binding protein